MDIVPDQAPLIVQARFSPDDADDLHVGQQALVRLPSLHDRTLADLNGRLTRLSADVFVDEHSGQGYYVDEVTVPVAELSRIDRRGGATTIRAGLPVEILVPLRARTAIDYLLEPLTEGFWAAFREH